MDPSRFRIVRTSTCYQRSREWIRTEPSSSQISFSISLLAASCIADLQNAWASLLRSRIYRSSSPVISGKAHVFCLLPPRRSPLWLWYSNTQAQGMRSLRFLKQTFDFGSIASQSYSMVQRNSVFGKCKQATVSPLLTESSQPLATKQSAIVALNCCNQYYNIIKDELYQRT